MSQGTEHGAPHRPGLAEHTDAARRVLLTPDHPGALPPALRIEAAARAADRTGQPGLAALYRALAPAATQAAAGPGDPALVTAVQDFTDAVTLDPAGTGPAALRTLTAHGLDTPAVVALAQICAFVAYEARVVSGLAVLAGGPAAEPAAVTGTRDAITGTRDAITGTRDAAATRDADASPSAPRAADFTLDQLTWRPRVPAVDADALTDAQRAVLDAHTTLSATSPYYRTLLHDPAALDHRTHVYNAVMYGRGGLPRAERELATLLVSRANGCVYCASVHGRKYAQLSRDEAAALRVLHEGADALAGDARGEALARFTRAQTLTPPAATGADVAALRTAGLDEAELTDLVHAVALFGWANRLMLVLGDVHPARKLDAGIPRTDARESCSGTSGRAAQAGDA
ncbi:peroxidase-related enzyme [Streptomyces corynorhini]|uniref:Carboxymuconolactone decarboxylase n=1 Tax=Streptomyces corynorhini TaxID=2282652 RepID=A0A370AUH4_9ACTN|nr:peroxidase-related enzyme [Streptomyces corynorhini]RDG33228.1 carboxymuconolactone decarboxylase [Streptomyces corynorhini]